MSTAHISIGTSSDGRACGTGDYEVGSCATLAATPDSGCRFVQWDDGISLNPRTVVVTGNETYKAQFASDAPAANVIRYNAATAATGDWVTNNTDTSLNTYDSQTGDGVLYLNAGVTTIGGGETTAYTPFSHNSGLTSIDFSDSGLTTLGKYTCYLCTNLTTVVIGNTITSIGASNDGFGVFEECTSLSSLSIGNSVTQLGNYAFYNCQSLTSLVIPSSVTSIGTNVFGSCIGLASITVASGNTAYNDGNGNNCIIDISTNKLRVACKNTIIPSGVTAIGNSAFNGCTGLTSVNIPDSVTSIEGLAFKGCSGLTALTIPANVTIISGQAIDSCPYLTSVTCLATTPPTLGTFNFTARNDTLYVPAASLSAYQSDTDWSAAFTTITAIV